MNNKLTYLNDNRIKPFEEFANKTKPTDLIKVFNIKFRLYRMFPAIQIPFNIEIFLMGYLDYSEKPHNMSLSTFCDLVGKISMVVPASLK